MTPVTEVFVHHEGAGDPTDSVERFAPEGYTIGIGVSRFAIFRTPAEDFATKGHNHVSLGICLSGDRMVHEVTDNDLSLIRAAMTEARKRGYVVANPTVRPHRAVRPTACPGDRTMDFWDEVAAAVQLSEPQEHEMTPDQVDLVLTAWLDKVLHRQEQPYIELRKSLRAQVRRAIEEEREVRQRAA